MACSVIDSFAGRGLHPGRKDLTATLVHNSCAVSFLVVVVLDLIIFSEREKS
jgi:hypothetical protein